MYAYFVGFWLGRKRDFKRKKKMIKKPCCKLAHRDEKVKWMICA